MLYMYCMEHLQKLTVQVGGLEQVRRVEECTTLDTPLPQVHTKAVHRKDRPRAQEYDKEIHLK